MCGILGIFDLKQSTDELRPQALQMSKKQRHRGPDWSGIFVSNNAILAHERLSIVDPTSGKQPLFSNDGVLALAVNGEIYNHKALKKILKTLTNSKQNLTVRSFWHYIRRKGSTLLKI